MSDVVSDEGSVDDRRVEAVFLGSRITGAAQAVVEGIASATRESCAVALVRTMRLELSHLSLAGMLRALGSVATIAASTALILNAFKPIPIGPLSWVLPAAVAALGALVAGFAESVSCAIADRRAGRVQSSSS